MEVKFPKLNHFWMDSGLLGLYQIAKDEKSGEIEVEIKLNDDGVLFKGTEANLDTFFHKTYDSLLAQYYNTSTQKQKEENAGFYYDSKSDIFVRFPKVKSMGIAGLIFSKGSGYKPTKSEKKYIKLKDESGKNIKSKLLPPEYAHLQERLDNFLSETELKNDTSSLLIDGPNTIKPSVTINVKPGKGKRTGKCFFCGDNSTDDIGSTVFPLITGSSGILSFNSGGGKPEKVCWKCDFIGKFAPVNGFYTMNNKSYHMYFPYSSSLEKMNDVFSFLYAIKIEKPNLTRNFNNQLSGYYPNPFEQLFAFLYSLYRIVMTRKSSKNPTDENYELDYERLYGITLSKASLEFFVMNTEALGETQIGKIIWQFQDLVYLSKLLDFMERNKININELMKILIDHEQENNKTILRNRICERILKKLSIVKLAEQHAFRINKSEFRYIKPLNDFVILYEKILKEDGGKSGQPFPSGDRGGRRPAGSPER